MEIARASVVNRSLKFKVVRREAELIPPAKPTPRETKRLSDLDNEESLQLLMPGILFFPSNPKMLGVDPVQVIRQALSKVLVFYYPLAGRIRKLANSTPKLVVECNEEGALFIEADADISLVELGDTLHPPYSYLNEIMYDVPGMGEILNSPVFHLQVTRLKCGGFILACRYNATIMDGTGLAQFLAAISGFARGVTKPSVIPVWDRDRLFARNPLAVTCTHPEFEDATGPPFLIQNKAYRIFYFTRKEIGALKNLVPLHLRKATSFELITGFLWRCRTIALEMEAEEEVRIIFALNARDRYVPPLARGFYGNAFAFAASMTTAGELCSRLLGYAVDLVVNAKNKVTEEYMRSFIDGLRERGWPRIPMLMSSFFTSDLRKMGYLDADFGWGVPHAAGPGIAWYEPYPQEETNYVLCRAGKSGELVTVVPMCLPEPAMKIFEEEIYSTLKIRGFDPYTPNGDVMRSYL